MKEIKIYTDGACSKNPGPGGWGAVLIYKSHRKEISGADAQTTNNRMELTAVIKALECLKEKCKIELFTDSKYVCDSIIKGWAESWRNNNWKKSDKKPAINADLWEVLLNLISKHDITFNWVKGHAGNIENERCDELATSEIKKLVL
ncbi:MAG: ribonuclease HI [Clostridia bacterium]|nr:ribonuclease HI [Clostridia bacterium]